MSKKENNPYSGSEAMILAIVGDFDDAIKYGVDEMLTEAQEDNDIKATKIKYDHPHQIT